MKKIVSFLSSILLTILLCSFTRTDVNNGSINDFSLVDNDLINLDLKPSDYYKLDISYGSPEFNDYDSWYIIAIAENRVTQSETDLYFYIYNPVRNNNNYSFFFDLRINDRNYDVLLGDSNISYDLKGNYISKGILAENVSKYKLSYKNDFNERNYLIDEIKCLNLNSISNNKFEGKFQEKINAKGIIETEFLYNSFVHITEDELIYFDFTKTAGFWGSIKNLFNGNLFNPDLGINSGFIVFYNFSCSRKIEDIIEFEYYINMYHEIKVNYDKPEMLDTVYKNYHQEGKQIKYPKLTNQMIKNELIEINTFKTPANKRLEEFDDIKLSTNAINSFTNFQHSVLIDIQEGNSSFSGGSSAGAVGTFTKTSTFFVNDMKVKRIKFKADGITYNSYVSDDSDSGIPGGSIGDPNLPWWERLIKWIIANPILSIAIAFSIVVCFPIIISLFPFILKIIFNLVKSLFMFLWFIISCPFKLIIKLFKRDKK